MSSNSEVSRIVLLKHWGGWGPGHRLLAVPSGTARVLVARGVAKYDDQADIGSAEAGPGDGASGRAVEYRGSKKATRNRRHRSR